MIEAKHGFVYRDLFGAVNQTVHKLGGYPSYIQGVYGIGTTEYGYEFVLQIATDARVCF